MRAATIRTPGPAHSISLVTVPVPSPGPGEIRIMVAAAGVNPVDLQTRSGMYHRLGWVTQAEHTGLGWDVSGTVSAVGAGVLDSHPHLTVGASVAALRAALDAPLGTYAEEVVVPADAAALVPDGVSMHEAAALPLVGLTALQGLDLLGDAAGRSLLVTGAAGGVGSHALALAAARGWVTTALVRPGNAGPVAEAPHRTLTSLEGLGAERFDAVFDAAVLPEQALAALRDGGAYLGVVPPAQPQPVRGIHVDAVNVRHDGAALAELLDLVRRGDLVSRVHRAVPLDEAAEAHASLEAGGLPGRLVLTP